MPFRQSGQRDDRRRRVLGDSLWGTTLSQSKARSAKKGRRTGRKSANYGDAEFLDEQFRLTDLVPLRLIPWAAMLVLGILAIAAIEGLHFWMPRLREHLQGAHLTALGLEGSGNLATWFSSMVLAMTGLLSVQVFLVRRYRVDDYHGHYRIWLWAAMGWLLASVDTVAGLRESLREVAVATTGVSLAGDGSIWWLLGYGLLVGGVGMRLLYDMRRSWLALMAMTLAGLSYGVVLAIRFKGLELPDPMPQILLQHGCLMGGNFLTLLAVGLHARHVVLDAEGLLPSPSQAAKTTSTASASKTGKASGTIVLQSRRDEVEEEEGTSSSDSQGPRIHPPHGTPRPAMASSPTATAVSAAAPFKPPAASTTSVTPPPVQSKPSPVHGSAEDAHRKLTKQERRALRERLDHMRRQREGD